MAPAFVAILMSVNWVSNRKYLIIMTDATRLIMVFTILGSLYQSLIRPFGQRFKVTAKGGDRNRVIIQWSLLWKLILLFALSVLGIVLNLVPEYAVIEDHEQQWVNFIWCFFNIVVIAISAMICVDLPRPRREERFVVNENSVIVVEDKQHPCLIKDLSLSGANIQIPLQGLPILHRLVLNVVGVGPMRCQISRTISPYEVGIEFVDLSSKRDAMIRKVYTSNYTNVSYYAYPGKLFLSILYRFFGHK
jgi:cellulose synthase (UDP-forming)